MSGVFADNKDITPTTDGLTLDTNFFNRSADTHNTVLE